jgi:predicted phospho-2-dehydro-3-deoxyheptonate aldolase
MIGKNIRLSQIINPETNRTCIIPMDHAVTLGPIDGLDNNLETIKAVSRGGADAIVLHKGVFKLISSCPEVTNKTSLLYHISASTSLSLDSNNKRLVSTVEQAVKIGAMGVSIHVNLGSITESDMLRDFGLVSDACINWGMPLLVMIYVRGNNLDSFSTQNIAHAAKVAEELGADIIKVNSPMCPRDISKVVQGVNTPVVVAGGAKTSIVELLTHLNEVLEAGASGVSMGRNIFQTQNVEATTRIISDLIHNRLSYTDAVYKVKEELRLE